MEPPKLSYVELNGVRIAEVIGGGVVVEARQQRGLPSRQGVGQRVVLLHGGGVGPWMWDRVASRLPDAVVVSAPTLPGHEVSAASQFTDHARAVEVLADQLGLDEPGAPFTLAGFSLGGQTAIQLAATYPARVERLVVMSSLLKPLRGAAAAAALARVSAPLARQPWFARLQARQLGVPDDWFERYLRTAEAVSARTLANLTLANSTFDAEPLLAHVTCHVRLVAGAEEPGAVLRAMREVNGRHPSMELIVVPGAGHTLPLTHPDVVARLIGDEHQPSAVHR